MATGEPGVNYGVLCADFGPQRDYAAFTAAAEAIARQAPRFGWRFWDATSTAHGTAGVGDCVGWPYEVRNPPHRLQVGAHPNVLVANPATGPKSVTELIARAKAHPGGVSYGSTGVNSGQHLAMEMLKQATGANLVHVPFILKRRR